jgi:hypothetical protein
MMTCDFLLACEKARGDLGHKRPEGMMYDPNQRFSLDEPVDPNVLRQWWNKVLTMNNIFTGLQPSLAGSQSMFDPTTRRRDGSNFGAGAGAGAGAAADNKPPLF